MSAQLLAADMTAGGLTGHQTAEQRALDASAGKRRPPAAAGEQGTGGGKKARKALLAVARAAVAAANKALGTREPREHRTAGGQTVQLHGHGQLERHALLLSWVAALVEENMRAMYEKGWGWDGDAKLDELASPKARYVIASLLPASDGDSAQSRGQDAREAPRSPAGGARADDGVGAAGTAGAGAPADASGSRVSPATVRRADRAPPRSPGFWSRLMHMAGLGTARAADPAALADALQQHAAQLPQNEGSRQSKGARPVGLVHYRSAYVHVSARALSPTRCVCVCVCVCLHMSSQICRSFSFSLSLSLSLSLALARARSLSLACSLALSHSLFPAPFSPTPCVRFCTDARRAVLYIYEIQVAAEAQGAGIGRLLLSEVYACMCVHVCVCVCVYVCTQGLGIGRLLLSEVCFTVLVGLFYCTSRPLLLYQ